MRHSCAVVYVIEQAVQNSYLLEADNLIKSAKVDAARILRIDCNNNIQRLSNNASPPLLLALGVH